MLVSITNKDSDTVRRMWFWLILGIYGGLLVVLVIFLALYLVSRNSRSTLTTDVQILFDENQKLNQTVNGLAEDIVKLEKANSLLEGKIKILLENNTHLNASVLATKKKIQEYEPKLKQAELLRNICFAVGGTSVLANLGLIPYSIIQLMAYNTLKGKLDYFQPRYLQGAINTMEGLMARELGQDIEFTILYSAGAKPSKADFNAKVKGYENTVTIIRTENEEVIAFVLHSAWATTGKIADTKAYTISFRKFILANIKVGSNAVVTTTDFLEIGDGEIAIDSAGKGKAKGGISFTPVSTSDLTDFYAQKGEFTLKEIFVYKWRLTGIP